MIALGKGYRRFQKEREKRKRKEWKFKIYHIDEKHVLNVYEI